MDAALEARGDLGPQETVTNVLVVKRGEKVTVEVPVVFEGEPASGTLVVNEVSTIKIEADAMKLPEEIKVSIEGVEAVSAYEVDVSPFRGGSGEEFATEIVRLLNECRKDLL